MNTKVSASFIKAKHMIQSCQTPEQIKNLYQFINTITDKDIYNRLMNIWLKRHDELIPRPSEDEIDSKMHEIFMTKNEISSYLNKVFKIK